MKRLPPPLVFRKHSIDDILTRLESVHSTGAGRWKSRCPVPDHADASPSLSIRDTGERVLLFCHAGCPYREICDALGIGPLELDRELMASERGREIARLSRRSHKVEAFFLAKEYGVSVPVAERLVKQRFSRERLPEVREFVQSRKRAGTPATALEYFEIEIGLSRATAERLSKGVRNDG